jgi:hypothetical protein
MRPKAQGEGCGAKGLAFSADETPVKLTIFISSEKIPNISNKVCSSTPASPTLNYE